MPFYIVCTIQLSNTLRHVRVHVAPFRPNQSAASSHYFSSTLQFRALRYEDDSQPLIPILLKV